MKILDYKVGTSFEITCVKEKINNKYTNDFKEYYSSFEIMPRLASMWAKNQEDVITVKATIIEEDVIIKDLFNNKDYDENCVDYFGWIDFEDYNKTKRYDIGLIYPNIKQYFVCFPYGADSGRFWNNDIGEHKKGDRRGMTVRLKIEEINK